MVILIETHDLEPAAVDSKRSKTQRLFDACDLPNPEAGWRLRAARERLGLSTRDVERLSRAMAEAKQNQEYYISHAWLSQIEKGELTPGIFKTYTLSTIYQYRFDEVLAFFGIQLSDLGREQLRQPLPLTRIVGAADPSRQIAREHSRTSLNAPTWSRECFPPREAPARPISAAHCLLYGVWVRGDQRLYALFSTDPAPGPFVEIDSLSGGSREPEGEVFTIGRSTSQSFVTTMPAPGARKEMAASSLIPYPESGAACGNFDPLLRPK